MKLDNFGCVAIDEYDKNEVTVILHDGNSDKFVRVACDLKSRLDKVDVSVDNYPYNDTIAYREQLFVDSTTVCIIDDYFDIDTEIGAQIKLTENQINQINEFLEGVEL